MGILSEQLDLIFDRFRQGDASTISSNFMMELSRLPAQREPHDGAR